MTCERGKVTEVPFWERAQARREQRMEMEAVNWLLHHLASELEPESATNKAIGRGATWREIINLAQWEALFEVVALLQDAVASIGPETLDQKIDPPPPARH